MYTPAPNSLAANADQIIFHFDGNNHDKDDIAAIPIAALLAAAGGVAERTTFLYGNNLTDPNAPARAVGLDAGGEFARSLGIEAYNYQDDIAGTTARLVAILNSGDDILLIEGGPMEAVYRALELTDPSLHKNLTLLSHSSWNENFNGTGRQGVDVARTWADIGRDFPDVTQLEIADQNSGQNNDKGFNNLNWSWMDNSREPLFQEAREIMQLADAKVNDPSDAGMMLYALTGNEDGTPQQFRAYVEGSGILAATPGEPPEPEPPGTPGEIEGRPVYMANANGVFHFDSEMAAPAGNWVAETRIPGFDGDNYYRWDGPNLYGRSQPLESSALKFDFAVDAPGTYSLAIEMARTRDGFNARGDEANDVFVSINGGEPTKIFSSGMPFEAFGDKWATTFDAGHQKSPARFDLDAGVHTLTVYGRSTNAIIDNITLAPGSTPSRNDAQPLSHAASLPPEPREPVGDPQTPPPSGPADPGGTAAFYLVDAAANERIAAITEGAAIDLSRLDGVSIEVVPPTGIGEVARVALSLNGETVRVENVEPYALFGDVGGDFIAGDLPAGPVTLGAAFLDASGRELARAEMSATVGNAPEPGDQPGGGEASMLRVFLVDTLTDEIITEVSPGGTIDPADLAGRTVSLAAIPIDGGEQIGSVRLTMGEQSRVENFSPYALFGDNTRGDYFDGTQFAPGAATLMLEVFSARGAGGETLETSQLTFTVGDAATTEARIDPFASLLAQVEAGQYPAADILDDEVEATLGELSYGQDSMPSAAPAGIAGSMNIEATVIGQDVPSEQELFG